MNFLKVNAKHPDVPFKEVLPQHEFTLGIISPKGAGKTTLIVNLLEFYKKYFETIIVFSPTLYADDKWDYVKKLPLLSENKRLEKWIEKQKRMKDKRTFRVLINPPPAKPGMTLFQPRDNTTLNSSTNPKMKAGEKEFDPHIPKHLMMTEYDESTLEQIVEEQEKLIESLETEGGTKHLANRILIIFDDLVGSTLFSGRRQNPFKKINTTHRHWSMSMIMVSQAYKEIPKTVRTNFSAIIIFEIPNQKELEVIYDDHPMHLDFKQWTKVYEYATTGAFNYLYINYQRPKELRMMKNFTKVIFFKQEETNEKDLLKQQDQKNNKISA
jgi:hypothetical protein